MSEAPRPGRLAGIDYGTVRIGIAVSDARQTLASPYENYTRRSLPADAEYFRRLVREEQIVQFVVGLPVHLSGESQKSTEARAFGAWLANETGLPVGYFDERFTSSEAEQFLGAAELSKKQRRARLDKLAAQIMLTAYWKAWRAVPTSRRRSTISELHESREYNIRMSQKNSSRASKLIIGCGYLGTRVAQRWLAAGHDVWAVTRSEHRAAEFAEQGLRPIVADILSPDSLSKLPAVQTVLYAVGYDRTAGRSIEEVYVDGLRHVLDALPTGVERLIYISSTGVYGSAQGEWVDEQTPCQPQRAGGKACLAAEELLVASRWQQQTIRLRMAGIYGPDRIPRRETLLAGEPIDAPAEGYLNLIHVHDAASVVLAADERAQPPRLYCVSDGHPAVRREYYECLAQLAGAPPPKFRVPAPDSPAAQRAEANRRVSNRRLLAELAVELEFPSFHEGLRNILESGEPKAESG